MIGAKPPESREVDVAEPLSKVAFACFAVTWLNPQAILDGTLLLGGMRASLPSAEAGFFIAGVALASCLWFGGLATAVRVFKKAMNGKVVRGINVACGIVLIFYGVKLGYELARIVLT